MEETIMVNQHLEGVITILIEDIARIEYRLEELLKEIQDRPEEDEMRMKVEDLRNGVQATLRCCNRR
jgi:hypothetical protein